MQFQDSGLPASLNESCELYMRDSFKALSQAQREEFAVHIRQCYSHATKFCVEHMKRAMSRSGKERRCVPCAPMVDLLDQARELDFQADHMTGAIEPVSKALN